MEHSNHMPLDLQFFAEPAPAPNPAPSPTPAPAPEPAPNPAPAPEPAKIPAFSELLKDKDFRSALDQHTLKATATAVENAVSKAVETAKAKWDEESKLSEAELAKKRKAEKETELSDREAKLAARELRADMTMEIAKRGLPAALIEAVSMVDKASAEASLAGIEKAYRASVEAGVTEKLKGAVPPGTGGGAAAGSIGSEIKSEMYPQK
jgi:type IV secretory pathway VirB10-like protein